MITTKCKLDKRKQIEKATAQFSYKPTSTANDLNSLPEKNANLMNGMKSKGDSKVLIKTTKKPTNR
jgi:hypothetical protein